MIEESVVSEEYKRLLDSINDLAVCINDSDEWLSLVFPQKGESPYPLRPKGEFWFFPNYSGPLMVKLGVESVSASSKGPANVRFLTAEEYQLENAPVQNQ